MQLKKAAVAGTLESSDVQVSVEPGEGTLTSPSKAVCSTSTAGRSWPRSARCSII